jgi:hypothetical protein
MELSLENWICERVRYAERLAHSARAAALRGNEQDARQLRDQVDQIYTDIERALPVNLEEIRELEPNFWQIAEKGNKTCLSSAT